MCNPAAVIGIQAAGTALSAYGSYTQGLAQKNYLNYAADNSDKQAAMVEKQGVQAANSSRDNGAESTRIFKNQEAKLEGAQKVAIGANLGGGSKTAEQITSDTFDRSRLDEMAIKYNADLESWRVLNEANQKAAQLRDQATGQRLAGKEALRAGKTAAFTDLLSGAGQVAGTWYTNKMTSPSTKTAKVNNRRIPVATSDYYLR